MATAVLPGGPLQIVFSFDTTLSMTSYVDQVKGRLQDMVQRLQTDIQGIKIALFAHGDYYQKKYRNKSPYITKFIDFTDNIVSLCDFIKGAEPTKGGDWEECYELVLKEAREKLTWSAEANKVIVMIGDAIAHETFDPENKDEISWERETKELLQQDIRTYGVYCKTPNSGEEDQKFFANLARTGDGSFLKLEQFGDIFDFMMAICYREKGEDALQAYEKEVRARGGSGVNKDVHNMFTTLKKSASNASTSSLKKTLSNTPTAAILNTNTRASTSPTTTKPNGGVKGTKTLTKRTRMSKGTVNQMTRKAKQTTKAGKVMTKATRTGPKSSKTVLPKKLRRENVPETNFRLRDLHWSKCERVIAWSDPNDDWTEYAKRRFPREGHRKRQIFQGKTNVPALYEFSVQPSFRCHKYAVFTVSSKGFLPRLCWEKELLKGKQVQKQIENVMKQNGCIFVRRLILRSYNKQRESIVDSMSIYDYAWESQRHVEKSDMVISDGMEVE